MDDVTAEYQQQLTALLEEYDLDDPDTTDGLPGKLAALLASGMRAAADAAFAESQP